MPPPPVPLSVAAAHLLDFVRGLPAYYGTLDAREPLLLGLIGLHLALVTGLVLARRSPAATLLILFLILVASYLSPRLADLLERHEPALLAGGILRTPRNPGILVLATWTLPAFAYALLFALLLLCSLARDIRRSARDARGDGKEA
ncbi:Transmembrane domain-containing protein [Giardia muris]|uniref:Transmembrane domain-containing protein n=1 Tax=Giardia muris TaxID=5742 RepID=A0A4Z1T3T4_GIAMU|nr:Transmembrane domain-containing protein [Giardia muris]|eukprot:TNJ27707.1 Transmembrane domain-containing protein [Giardia muris]